MFPRRTGQQDQVPQRFRQMRKTIVRLTVGDRVKKENVASTTEQGAHRLAVGLNQRG